MLLVLFMLTAMLSGCSFNIKTPVVGDYEKLQDIKSTSTQAEVKALVGSPQSTGVHIVNGNQNELDFYSGMYGKFTLSSALYKSGGAFITYNSGIVKNVIQMHRKLEDGELEYGKAIPIKTVVDTIVIGKSNIDSLYAALAQPTSRGKRISSTDKIDHDLAYWDASKIQDDKAIVEKWLLVGFDSNKIIQDVIWVSSVPEDIKEYGEISDNNFKKSNFPSLFTYSGNPTIENVSKIDAFYVDALIKSKAQNVSDFILKFGLPTAIGLKSFEGEQPLNLSNWTYSKMKISGKTENFIPPNANSLDAANGLVGATFMNMDIKQSRLIVGHDDKGVIKEIFWVHPIE